MSDKEAMSNCSGTHDQLLMSGNANPENCRMCGRSPAHLLLLLDAPAPYQVGVGIGLDLIVFQAGNGSVDFEH